jgi:subtilase family serine protease
VRRNQAAKPDYQASANILASVNPGKFVGHGLPDVAGDADPATGYDVYVDGQAAVFGGTSAVAPLWAGLIACINELLGKRAGFLNPTLYTQVAGAGGLHDITSGNNGSYAAGPGWDACTGLGSPDGAAIAGALTGKGVGAAKTANRREKLLLDTGAPPRRVPRVGPFFRLSRSGKPALSGRRFRRSREVRSRPKYGQFAASAHATTPTASPQE